MKKLLVFLAIGLLFSSVAYATSSPIVQTKYYDDEVINISDTMTFDKFDPALGTLNYVKLTLSLEVVSGGFVADNDSTSPATVSYTWLIVAGLISSDVFISPAVGFTMSDTVLVSLDGDPDYDGTNDPQAAIIDGTAPDGHVLDITGESDSSSQFMAVGAAMNSYIGPGTFDIDLTAIRDFEISGGSGVEGGYTNMLADGFVEVEYCYTVPEPMTMSLLALGGLAVVRRKRS